MQYSKISVIIPVYNEEKTIAGIIDKVLNVSLPLEKEIIAVNDGSTDGTQNILAGIASRQVKAYNLPKNRGKGAAIREALKHVTGDIVLIQDADLEYCPEDYPQLIKPITAGIADVVYGSRFLGGGHHRVHLFWHYLGNRFLSMLSNMFSNLNLTDMEVGLKAFKSEIIQKIRLKENRFGFEPEVTLKIARLNCIVYEVPVSYYGRTYAEGKKIGWKDGFRALWCILRYGLFK